MSNSKSSIVGIIKTSLSIVGGLTLIVGLFVGLYMMFVFRTGNSNSHNKASKEDVKFVLNWAGLGDERISKVHSSYESARSLTGDHLDAYDIEVTHIKLVELKKSNYRQWHRGDSLPEFLDKSVELVGGWQYEIPWFPKEAELRTSEYYVYPWSTYFHGTNCTSAKLTFVNPNSNRVYYISAKM